MAFSPDGKVLLTIEADADGPALGRDNGCSPRGQRFRCPAGFA